jgi:hypothetical protein
VSLLRLPTNNNALGCLPDPFDWRDYSYPKLAELASLPLDPGDVQFIDHTSKFSATRQQALLAGIPLPEDMKS